MLKKVEERAPIDHEFRNNLATSLTEQPWTDIGFGSGTIAPSNREMMTTQICAIFENRLSQVAISKAGQYGRTRIHPFDIPFGAKQRSIPNISSSSIREQIRDFVTRISSLYRNVKYHNFEHAHHVTVSVNKMLNMLFEEEDYDKEALERFVNTPSICSSSTSPMSSFLSRLSLATSTRSSTCSATEPESQSQISFSSRKSFATRSSCSSTASTSCRSLSSKQEDPAVEMEQTRDENDSPPAVDMDAITKFAAVFGALIHDVDHRGVSNMQLVKEGHKLATKYNNKSIAENHSLNMALDIIMEPSYKEMRSVFMSCPDDKMEFRTTICDVLLCTDIASPVQAKLRKTKWEETFGSSAPEEQLWSSDVTFRRHSMCSVNASILNCKKGTSQPIIIMPIYPHVALERTDTDDENDDNENTTKRKNVGEKRVLNVNGDLIEFYQKRNANGSLDRLKVSVVLETLMNAADVAHTMQSWNNFIKWNTKLFHEIYAAHTEGRGNDPSENWFAGQIGFFDAYVLPLSRRLARCGNFGDEGNDLFLRNASENRRRWLVEGQEITQNLIEKANNTSKQETTVKRLSGGVA
eukprot:CAMPEP_0172510286 /NCGR_PEP_ID=MMETSP1066-20121228/227647_1 /TAXON_ID=671091 /ORGANISM="Coscinodiscus wailesii, Strain CCMP2513" /LENGTH=580 /DNA_ID=CAMNT_0013289185 /DNA_START=30 /DNA_END=1772 /DNA_ORIENTATION=+